MNNLNKEKGAVLITSLVLLVILTLLGLSAMQDASMEERMVGNMRGQSIAFQSAESALREGEDKVGNWRQVIDRANTTEKVWDLDGPDVTELNDTPWWKERNGSWWETVANQIHVYTNTLAYKTGSNLTTQPRYVLEYRESVCDSLEIPCPVSSSKYYYQVTARGVDESKRSEILLRSTFSRR